MSQLVRAALAALILLPIAARAADDAKPTPPKTWVDKDTGHRVWRLSEEPNSGGFYFNVNGYTPDQKTMIYTAPDGIHAMDMETMKTRLIVPNPGPPTTGPSRGGGNPPRPANAPSGPGGFFRYGVHALVAGFKTNSVFYTQTDPQTNVTSVYKADVYTGQIRKLVDLPAHRMIVCVNADETLAAGTFLVDENARDYGQNMPAPPPSSTGGGDNRVASPEQGPHYQPLDKGQMMERRLAAHYPLVLFTIRLEPGPNGEKPGDIKELLHSTDWVNHLLFSPTDPELLMYCHEGPWQKVDRIWMIHTDGTHNTLIHKRTMVNEIFGHEFWGLDGETIWYDWQFPKGEDFFLAGYNLKTGQRTAFHLQRDEWGIHFNLTGNSISSATTAAIPARWRTQKTASGSSCCIPKCRKCQKARSTTPASGSPASSTPSTWSTCRTTTIVKSPTCASHPIRSSSSSPATCSAPAMSSVSKSPRPIRQPPMCSPHLSWLRNSTLLTQRQPTLRDSCKIASHAFGRMSARHRYG